MCKIRNTISFEKSLTPFPISLPKNFFRNPVAYLRLHFSRSSIQKISGSETACINNGSDCNKLPIIGLIVCSTKTQKLVQKPFFKKYSENAFSGEIAIWILQNKQVSSKCSLSQHNCSYDPYFYFYLLPNWAWLVLG